MEKRILELALEALEGQRALLSAEIEMIRTQLDSGAKAKPNLKDAHAGKRKARSAAQRKAQSERMKANWAARKKAADKQMRSKPKSGQATPANRKGQTRKKQAEQKKKS